MNKLFPNQVEFWDCWHQKRSEIDPLGMKKPLPFAYEVLPVFNTLNTKIILDLGCGQCSDSIFFAKAGFEVHAIDFSSYGLSKAKSEIETQGIGRLSNPVERMEPRR